MEVEAYKLIAIICEYFFGDPKPTACDVLLNEILNFAVFDLVESFILYPLAEVVSDCKHACRPIFLEEGETLVQSVGICCSIERSS